VVDLAVEIGGLRLANPVMPASGTFAEGLARIIDFNRLGAFVIKTVTRELRAGNPTPRVAETAGGMLNSIGIPSKGVDYFFKETLPFYRQFTPPLIASLSAPTADGFASLAAELSVPGVAAIEANISCPNLEEDGRAFAMTAHSTEAVMKRLRAATKLPLWAKLTPNTGDIADVARAAEAAGADAVVVANTILAMSIDVDTFRPTLGSVTGGLSGPAIKPVIMRQVYQCARAVKIGIVGYYLQQVTADGGIGDILGDRKLRVAGAGPAAMFSFSVNNVPLYVVAKYYREFSAQNTTQGGSGTLSIRAAF